jgi:mannose-6-phosphate isomerase-like protein (cupin superfamily)
MKYLSRFSKETARPSHNGTILADRIISEGMKTPFGHAWGHMEGKSAMEGHSHPTDEVYIIVSGSGYCEVAGERFAVKQGDVVEIPANAPHTIESEEGELLWTAFWWDPIE